MLNIPGRVLALHGIHTNMYNMYVYQSIVIIYNVMYLIRTYTGQPGRQGVSGNNGPQGPRGLPGPPGITVLNSNTEKRVKSELYQQLKEDINKEITEKMEKMQKQTTTLGMNSESPADDCQHIFNNNPQNGDGYYWIRSSRNNTAIRVYCYMTGYNCGGGVWMRIGEINMNRRFSQCPGTLQRVYINNGRYCYRRSSPCSTVSFDSFGKNYTEVCGYVKAYQYGSPDAFQSNNPSIGFYGEGISVTHGSSKSHLWSYIMGSRYPSRSYYGSSGNCPCNTYGSTSSAISQVGTNYYCDSGVQSNSNPSSSTLYTSYGVLWSRSSICRSYSTCCNDPDQPWFKATTNTSTNDNVDLNWCASSSVGDEEAATTDVLLYIKVA